MDTKIENRSKVNTHTGMWECTVEITVGNRKMFCVGIADTEAEAEQDIEEGFGEAVERLDLIGGIWKRTGCLDWDAMERACAPGPRRHLVVLDARGEPIAVHDTPEAAAAYMAKRAIAMLDEGCSTVEKAMTLIQVDG